MATYIRRMFVIIMVMLFITMSASTTTSSRGSTTRGSNKLRVKRRVVNNDKPFIDGHVSLSYLHKKYIHSLASPDDILSTTLLIKLTPMEDKMNPHTMVDFEEGMTDFLSVQFDGQETYDLDITKVTTLKQNVENHVLFVECVVLAQLYPKSPALSSEEFGSIVLNMCSEFTDKLIEYWMDKEYLRIGDDDHINDRLVFGLVQHSGVSSVAYSNLPTQDKSKHTSLSRILGVYFPISVGAIAIALLGFAIHQRRMRKRELNSIKSELNQSKPTKEPSINEALSSLKQRNIYEILQTASSTDSTSFDPSPYDNIELTPPKRKQNKYERLKSTDLSSDFDENQDELLQKSSSVSSSSSTISSKSPLRSRYSSRREKKKKSASPPLPSTLSSSSSPIRREIYAPPGKLGVALDTVNGQAVVHRIRDGSPLQGILHQLDVIVEVDGIDTSSMSAADVTSLMAKKMHSNRKIAFERGEGRQSLLELNSVYST